jgi:hypothetical protein
MKIIFVLLPPRIPIPQTTNRPPVLLDSQLHFHEEEKNTFANFIRDEEVKAELNKEINYDCICTIY